jgi:hypothetical protein
MTMYSVSTEIRATLPNTNPTRFHLRWWSVPRHTRHFRTPSASDSSTTSPSRFVASSCNTPTNTKSEAPVAHSSIPTPTLNLTNVAGVDADNKPFGRLSLSYCPGMTSAIGSAVQLTIQGSIVRPPDPLFEGHSNGAKT